MPLSFADIGAKVDDIPKLLDMLGADEKDKTEGNYVRLHRSDCEKIYQIAATYQG